MKFNVYNITDREAIECIINNDLEGFAQYIDNSGAPWPESFDSEKQALKFCAMLGRGRNDREPSIYPLRSFEEADKPFIEIIECY